ncbi:hypothetical protein [Ohtaekwangia sp.]|uniref:hypothetical protein n=1 Tax=Ohtaekwangia sp. TaxID=2066019 RepID=UPI002F938151
MSKPVKGKRHRVKKRQEQRSRPDQRERFVRIKTAQEENTEPSAASPSEQTVNDKAMEKQPRVNEDAQRNIVNHPEHAGDDITDERDKY